MFRSMLLLFSYGMMITISDPLALGDSVASTDSSTLQRHDSLVATGEDCYNQGNIQCAYDNYWAAVDMKPNSGGAQAGLGLSLFAAGHHIQAGEHLRQALLLLTPGMPGSSECQVRVSVQEALAEVRYDELVVAPVTDGARHSKAEVTEQAFLESMAMFSRAIQMGRHCGEQQQDREEVVVATLMKKAWFAQVRHHKDDALAALREVLTLSPSHMIAHLNIGNIHFNSGEYREALRWYKLARDVASSKQHKLLALNNLGSVFRIAGHIKLSLEQYLMGFSLITEADAILSLSHEEVEDSNNLDLYTLDNTLTMMGICISWRHMEVLEHVKWQRVQLLVDRKLALLDKEAQQPEHDDSTRYSREEFKIDLYSLTLGRFNTLEGERVMAQETCYDASTLGHSSHLVGQVKLRKDKNAARSPVLRVGYVSFDWKNHPMGRLTSYFVTHHNNDIVTSHAFSYCPNDSSPPRQRVEREANSFVDLRNIPSDDVAADVMRQHELDVVVDLTLWTESGRVSLVNRRLAPVTINYLGFPGTSGCAGYDFALVDTISVPVETANAFTEKLIYVPRLFSYQANDMPFDASPCRYLRQHIGGGHDEDNTTPALHSTSKVVSQRTKLRQECQARVNGSHTTENVLLCSFNAEKKYEPIVFTAWMNILRRVPQGILLLLVPSDFARDNILDLVASHGIHPRRIVFMSKMPWKKHLHRAAACDLLLDTFVYGAHTTASDMLWQWVPVVSLASWGSGRMPSRVASSILHSMTTDTYSTSSSSSPTPVSPQPHHTVAYSVAEYEDIVVRLSLSETLLFALKHAIAVSTLRSFAFDKLSRQQILEHSYQQSWEIRAMVPSQQNLFHIIAGDYFDAPVSYYDRREDLAHGHVHAASRLCLHAVAILHSLDCRIAKEIDYPLKTCGGGRDISVDEEICCDASDTAGGTDQSNIRLECLRMAKDALLLRLSAGAPLLLADYRSTDPAFNY